MRVALLQLNPTVGALEDNARALQEAYAVAVSHGADVVLASELCLVGYPPRDLLERPHFVDAVQDRTRAVVRSVEDCPLVFGTVGSAPGGMLFNQAVVAQGGMELGRATKQLLPTYDIFDERRYFSPGTELLVLPLAGKRCAVSVCEDAWYGVEGSERWYRADPFGSAKSQRVEVVLNLSASPFTLSKRWQRPRLFSALAQRLGVPVVMANQVGGNDELIFDGASAAWDGEGRQLAQAPAFESGTTIVDLREPPAGAGSEPGLPCEEQAVAEALTLGLRDYVRKCGFSRVVVGLSGGIDSALVAALAADALGPGQVLGIGMPSRYSSEGSIHDAETLASNLGIGFEVVPIEAPLAAYEQQLEPLFSTLPEPQPGDVTWENVQARIRGAILMATSNRSGAMVLTTGNKSEVAVGYCTLYGDMVGGLSVISDVPKTMVYRICRWLNRKQERIPESTLTKPPSAELRPDQKDEDSLPPYEILDPIVAQLVEEQRSPAELIADGHPEEAVRRVATLLKGAEYKRRQAAPGLIVTSKAFGPGRRLPLAQRFWG